MALVKATSSWFEVLNRLSSFVVLLQVSYSWKPLPVELLSTKNTVNDKLSYSHPPLSLSSQSPCRHPIHESPEDNQPCTSSYML